MELDNLKQDWNQQSTQSLQPTKVEAEVLIGHQSYGPVAVLKAKFLRQLLIFPVALAVVLYDIYKRPELLQSVEFGIFVLALFLLGTYFAINFLIVGRLQQYNANLKSSILSDVKRIENGLIWFQVVHAVLMVCMMIAIEVKVDPLMNVELVDWYAVNPFLRVGAYILILVFVLYTGRKRMLKTYGTHLDFLKAALQKMEA